MYEDLEASHSYKPIIYDIINPIYDSWPQLVAIGRVPFETQESLALKAYSSVSES